MSDKIRGKPTVQPYRSLEEASSKKNNAFRSRQEAWTRTPEN